MKEIKYKKVIKYITHPNDVSNIVLNSIVLIILTITGSILNLNYLVYFGIGINLFYFLIVYWDREVYYKKLKTP